MLQNPDGAQFPLVFLANDSYITAMKATLTSKGQITIPVGIREKLGLKAGQVLDFDEAAPFVKAVPIFDEDEMVSAVGCAKANLGRNSGQWLDETRGRVDLAPESR